MTAIVDQPAPPPNPYAAPMFAEPGTLRFDFEIASPWLRLLARIVDNILQFGWFAVFAFEHPLVRSHGELGALGLLVPLPCLAVVILQAVLIARSGASIGKRIFGLKIIRRDGSEAGLYHGWISRSLIYGAFELAGNWLLFYLPALADALFIFTRDGETLHDRAADTYVIKAR
jgi:uncharacterized RDD family membrane protein YckC